jgi:hypothetical protein
MVLVHHCCLGFLQWKTTFILPDTVNNEYSTLEELVFEH